MYYAEFITHPLSGHTYRHDTRIYLSGFTGNRSGGRCVGAFIGKNPGSALRSASGWGLIQEDTTLRLIRSVWLKSLKAKPNPDEYIQVLNLFYLCDPNFQKALKLAMKSSLYFPDPVENQPFEKVWWAIGDYDDASYRLGYCLRRIQSSVRSSKHVFYDSRKNAGKGREITGLPSAGHFCKHPIGMPHPPMEKLLSL